MGSVTVPMGPPTVNITGVRAGDRNLMTMTVSSGGQPVDLTNLTPVAHARLNRTDAQPTLVAEIEILDAAAGWISLRWPGDQVRMALGTAEAWNGVWDLQLESAAEDPVTIAEGKFGAVLDVTRDVP